MKTYFKLIGSSLDMKRFSFRQDITGRQIGLPFGHDFLFTIRICQTVISDILDIICEPENETEIAQKCKILTLN